MNTINEPLPDDVINAGYQALRYDPEKDSDESSVIRKPEDIERSWLVGRSAIAGSCQRESTPPSSMDPKIETTKPGGFRNPTKNEVMREQSTKNRKTPFIV